MLTDKVRVEQSCESSDPEDIFSSSLGLIFTDDVRAEHGNPGAIVVYKSARFSDVRLTAADPEAEGDRLLFAQYLWNASLYMSELIQDGIWKVEGEKVLELGAGLGLAGIVSGLAGAECVVLSDYSAPGLLENLSRNVTANLASHQASLVSVQGHIWGQLDNAFGESHAGFFTRILAADCFWMPWEHDNLVTSMLHFLGPDSTARIFVVAGFHTGRAKLAPFFDHVVERGLEIESIREVDVEGNTRPWAKERDGGREDVIGRRRWLVEAVLKRPET